MEVKQTQVQDFTVIAMIGEVDLNSSPQVRKVFDELTKKGINKVIVDFKNVAYIDSSGLATLIEMMQRIKKNHGCMYLVDMSDKIRGLFEITKLDKLFKIFPTQQEALAG